MRKLLKQLFLLLPPFVKRKVNSFRESERQKNALNIRKLNKITKQEINSIFDVLDLNCDVFLHSSLRNFGYEIEGGKEMVVKTIIDHIDLDKYTLLAPALPFKTSMKEFLDSTKSLDMSIVPNEMGAVSNAIGKMEGCLRSLHPTHSVVAIGAKAIDYTSTHHLDNTPFTVNSPYYKIMENKGKILLFGVGLGNLTFPHVIEDLLGEYFPEKVYNEKVYAVEIVDLDGTKHNVTTRCHDQKLSLKRDCEFIRKSLIKEKAIQTFELGLSEVSLLDPKKYAITYLKMLLDGKSLYGKFNINNKAKKHILAIIDYIEAEF